MPDIESVFANIVSSTYDRPHNLEALDLWSKDIAIELAQKESITLIPAHWEVIDALRNHYQEFGLEDNARSLLKRLEVEFDNWVAKYICMAGFRAGLSIRPAALPACRCHPIVAIPHLVR